jgi:NAD-dependent DNA ligase
MSWEQKSLIRAMVNKWTADHKDEQLPPQLAILAERTGFLPEKAACTPTQRGKKDKVSINTPSATDRDIPGSLKGFHFVMTGSWPELGGGHGLTSGRLSLKSRIEKFGGSVTSNYSWLTNFLVVGDNPGSKMVIEAHKKKLKIININQLTRIMVGELMINDLRAEDYPEAARTVLEAKNIQVQRHPNPSSSDTQAAGGSDEDKFLKPSDDAAGDGHSNG